ncbi:MAG: calcium/sodium antiporter, partial [Sphingomonadales bacterium]
AILFLIGGIILLTLGGEAVVRGALAAASRLGVSPLLAGLVIVGFGTSAPEMVVSVDAALNQQPDIAIGNVVGSNIGNILLILGICAIITPMTIHPRGLLRDGTVMVGASVLFVVLAWGSAVVRTDAVILLAAFGGYLVWAYLTERRDQSPIAQIHRDEGSEIKAVPHHPAIIIAVLIVGMAALIGGSRLLVTGATEIATAAGLPEAVIGLTLVAVGTSLPELAVSLMAAIRRHADVAVGNILGSNIFNLLGILGLSAILQPLPIHPRIVAVDQWVMLASALVLVVFLRTGHRINRIEGAALLAGYVAYVIASFTLI